MIKNFGDHAANERTFLAWLRTGLSIAAFGFVVEKLNLFLAFVARSNPERAAPPEAHELTRRIFESFGHYDGFIISLAGVLIMVLGTIRFMRAEREIERPELRRSNRGGRAELLISGVLSVLAASFCVYLALQ